MRDQYADLPISVKEEHFHKLNDYQAALMAQPVLKSLFIEMTLNCNEHCLHCGSNCGDMPAVDALTDYEIIECMIKLKDSLKKAKKPLPFINVTGGEPLLRPHMVELMKTIHALGYKWGMTSNGTLITKEVAFALKDAGMYSVGLSLDGLKDTHNWFRNAPFAYDKAIEAFHYLTEARIDNVMITTVVHKRNIEELDAIYELMKEIDCRQWRVINVEPIGRALTNPDLMLESKDYQYILNFIANHQNDPKMNVIYSCNHYVGLELERKVRPWYFQCRAGVSVASIQYNGDISACLDIERRKELIFGNIRENDLYETWLNRFEIYRKPKTLESTKCKGCEHEDNCKGGGFHTWDFDAHNPRICMMEELGLLK